MKFKSAVAGSVLSALVLLGGCSSKKDQYLLFNESQNEVKASVGAATVEHADQQIRDTYEYKLIPNNRLSILMYNHPELSTRDVRAQIAPADERGTLIANDGTIDIPLIGVIRVAGLSSREAADLLSKEYSRYIKNAHVTVEVLNKRVYVLGEVKNPGRVNIIEDTGNILEAIAGSGGLTDFAAQNSIKIIRGTQEKPIVKTVDLTKLSSVGGLNLMLQPNDVVYVQPNELRRRNMAIAEALPGINLVQGVLSALFTGKQLTNTEVFNVSPYTGYQQ